MSYQVLVKTAPLMNGAYTFLLATAEERAEFVQRTDVFWYHYPEEDDWQWHRGGAWKPSHLLTPAEQAEQDQITRNIAMRTADEIREDLEDMPLPGQVSIEDVTDDEEDDRW